MWRLPDGEMFLVVRNHLGRRVPRNVLARYRRLRSRREPDEGSPSIPWTLRAVVARTRSRQSEAIMSKKSKSSSNQRANVKNSNNRAYRADRANRIAQGHPNPPPPPPATMTSQDK